MVRLSNLQTAGLCRELALLLHAGVSVGDGLSLLAQEESAAALRPVLENMAHYTDEGGSLAGAMREAACFPGYVCGLVEVGERSGRTEEALQALAGYYDGREQMDRRIRAALLYPSVLMLVMLVVIVVLLSRVLPVFNDVYASLGGELTGLAGGLLTLGMGLDAAMPVLCVILAVVVITLGVFSVSGGFRQKVLGFWQKRWGDRGIARRLSDARFAQALSMGMRSGLPMEESLDLAQGLLEEVPAASARCRACRSLLEEGCDLAQALRQTQVLPASACRMLALGVRSGSADSVMEEISRRLAREADQALEDRAAQIEPAMVLVCSLMVGAILLSVMLPLMNIMSAIG